LPCRKAVAELGIPARMGFRSWRQRRMTYQEKSNFPTG
jgi:hypothetical protein